MYVSYSFSAAYFHFSDPLIIVAAVILIARVPSLQHHKWIYPIGVVLIGLHLVFSQADPIKESLLLRSGPESKCDILNDLQRMERFPFCKQ